MLFMPVAKWFGPNDITPGSFSKFTFPISLLSKFISTIEISVKLFKTAIFDLLKNNQLIKYNNPHSDVTIGIEVKNPITYPLLVAATNNYPFL